MLVDKVTIQPDQKVDLVCEVKGASLEGIQGVLEPMDTFFQRFPIAASSTPSLVNIRSVPVRFCNYSDRPVTIYKDTSVGELCPAVESGQIIPRHATTGLRPFFMTVIKGHSTVMHCHLKRNRIGIQSMR